MADKRSFPGSKWWKFDFHAHTPESKDYSRGDGSSKNAQPEEWLRRAMESGLDCVAVTDHNSGKYIDELKKKNSELQGRSDRPDWYRELTIFPGVEITVADSGSRVHLLAVFDPGCDSQTVTGVLGSCGITSGFGDDERTSTTTGFVETVRKIRAAKGIAIPPHVDGPKGLLENAASLTPELEKSLNEVYAAEFCNLRKFDEANQSLKTAVKRLAKVAGSDAHKPEDIGRRFSWLKMTRPSIEGLRLALSEHEFCVRNESEDPNQLPGVFLTQLTIRAMRHCGRISDRPLVTELHPHLNTIIGGRGTGKSTIVESIRIASRRDRDLATEAPGIKDELDKFMTPWWDRGVMEDDTEILLELHRRGTNFRLRWRHDNEGAALEEKINGDWQEIEGGDLRERFSVSIFSQKQINELASNPRGLLNIVDRSPEVNRAEWNSHWEGERSRFLQLRERRRDLSRQLAEGQQLRIRLGDLEKDLRQYEEKGHGEVLKLYQRRSRQKNGLPDDAVFDELSSSIRALVAGAGLSDFPENLFDEQDETTAEIREIHERASQGLEKIGESLSALAENADALKTQRAKEISESDWHKSVEASAAAYGELVKAYEEGPSQLSISLYGDWVQKRSQLQQQLKNLDAIGKEAELTDEQIRESLEELQDLRTKLFKKRRKFLVKVIGKSKFVRMELLQFGDASTFENEYRTVLNLEEEKFVSSVCDGENRRGLLFTFSDWENSETAESELPKLLSEIKTNTLRIAKGEDYGNHAAFDKRLKWLLETQPAVFDQLDALWPEDLLRVRYSKDPSGGKFEDLEKGSAGQKAAAILAFLLSHGNEPLVIDQPEDDLDNALIYDLIVTQIHKNKNQRQLIIVTHNPNIVVNGDSELVHVLKFQNGQVQIDKQGGLEDLSIRDAICAIMEGGREAFDKRYKRITLEG